MVGFKKRKKIFKVLAIDGGGIRGIIPGTLLLALEQRLQKASGNAHARLSDFFDLVAGTSTGGILACLYLMPQRYAAQQALDFYCQHSPEIFDLKLWQRIKTLDGLLDEKYPSGPPQKLAQHYFGDTRLSQLTKPCLITAYDIQEKRAFFFTQHTARQHPRHDFYVRDIARATSAAPSFFNVALIHSQQKDAAPHALIDGGVFANNPALCAFAEAHKFPGQPQAQNMFILSLGTGIFSNPYPYAQAKDWGLVDWLKPLINILSTSGPEVVNYQLETLFNAAKVPQQYLRLNPDFIRGQYRHHPTPDIDNVSAENLKALKAAGLEAVEKFAAPLDQAVKCLLAN